MCISKVKGHATGQRFVMVILQLMKLLTLVVVGSGLMLLMLGGIFLVSVDCGILLVVNCDDSSSLAPHPLVWSAGAFQRGAAS